MFRRVTAVILVAGVLLTAGCGIGAEPAVGGDGEVVAPDRSGRSPGVAEVRPRWTSCDDEAPAYSPDRGVPDGLDALHLPRLGPGFAPVAVVMCEHRPQRRTDGGEDLVAAESRSGDVARLVAALNLPDQPPADGACTHELPMVPWFVLLDQQGRWVRPGVPIDGCGKIRREVRDAIAGLALTRVAARRIRELESAGAAAAGCNQNWKYMVAVEAGSGRSDWSESVALWPATAAVRLCVYRVPPQESASGTPTGEFLSGGLLAERWKPIRAALDAAGPAAGCGRAAKRFAVLLPDGGGPEAYVELDGCRRVLLTAEEGPPALRQADTGLVALLAGR